MNTRKIGADYEEKAAAYLEKNGYRILERNFRCRTGEIDLVARDGRYLVFVEVKYRANAALGSALEAVGPRKQAVIRQTAAYYMLLHHLPSDTPCRFDVAGITGEEIVLIRNAF